MTSLQSTVDTLQRLSPHIVAVSADGGLLLLGPHQVDVSLVVTHLRQGARDVGLLKHLKGGGVSGGAGQTP